MNKYFEVLPISEKPEKDGSYMTIGFGFGKTEFKENKWHDWTEKNTHWLRPLTSLPIDTDTTEKIASAIEKIKRNLFQNENDSHKSSYNTGVRDALEILEPLIKQP